MRFGLTMNSRLDCDVWIDLQDEDTVPLVSGDKIFVQLQQKCA